MSRLLANIPIDEIKDSLSISKVLRHYGATCVNENSGSWWCPIHEVGGKQTGHKTPSLVARDLHNTATCLSRGCLESDDIFSTIGKLEGFVDFQDQKARACDLAGISYTKAYADNQKKSTSYTATNNTIKPLENIHIQYLNSIGVSKNTAEFFSLRSQGNYIFYPQRNKDEVLGYKGISIDKTSDNGKKRIFFSGNKVDLWGDIDNAFSKNIIFVEGEKDCMRLYEDISQKNKLNEYAVLTITTGANSVPQNLAEEIMNLQPKSISIFYDNDAPGFNGSKKLAIELAKYIDEVWVYSFENTKKTGYDVSDFLNEGNSLYDLFDLRKEIFNKESRTIFSICESYTLNESKISEILQPNEILYTGYKEIDKFCPIVLGENTVIVGRTGKGKTVCGVNFVNGILQNNESTKIVVFSLELDKKNFIKRLINSQYNIEANKNSYENEEAPPSIDINLENQLSGYISKYKDRLLIVDDIYSMEGILSTLETMESVNFHPNYILIDYINILSFKNLTDLNKHIQISSAIKLLAKSKKMHVQIICQANRLTLENEEGYARTENLADSDQYGRDAFIVYSIKTLLDSKIFYINPTKHRNGISDKEIILKWNPKSGKIFSHKETFVDNKI